MVKREQNAYLESKWRDSYHSVCLDIRYIIVIQTARVHVKLCHRAFLLEGFSFSLLVKQ